MIYITEEGFKKLIDEFNSLYKNKHNLTDEGVDEMKFLSKLIGRKMTILPVEESWEDVFNGRNKYFPIDACNNTYPNGVIIKNKQ